MLRSRVGYLPGELVLYDRLTAEEHLAYFARLRGAGSDAIPGLAQRLSLELHRPVGTLSKGNRQKVGLIQASMHEPDLLILDEPTGGLDPLVQREFADLLQEAQARGQSALVSSHVLSEVERVADRVALIRDGRLALIEGIGTLGARAKRRLDLNFAAPADPAAFVGLPGVRNVQADGHVLRLVLAGPADSVIKTAARFEVLTVTSHEPDLEDLFLELYNRGEK